MPATIVNILTAQYDLVAGGNPLTITPAGGVEVSGSTAIYGSSAQAWTITNAGTLLGAHGISLKAGGTITNTGSIIATSTGVSVTGGKQSVSNSGTIRGSNDGVALIGGSLGVVTNLAGGTIAGTGNVGVYSSDSSSTVTNAGTIIGNAGKQAVQFVGGGTDRVIVDPGAVFIGKVQGGSGTNSLELASGNGNIGTIGGIGTQFVGFGTIAVDTGATWSLVNSGTLSGVSSLINHGTLVGSGVIDVASLFNDGTIAAAAQLTVGVSLVNQGSIATTVTLASGATLDNYGSITTVYAVKTAGAAAFVINSGTLVANDVIQLTDGGAVTNLSHGLIDSDSAGNGVVIKDASGTVTNSGTIIGNFYAVYLYDGGTISNLSGGALQAGRFGNGFVGALIGGGSGTITNAGTIIGGDNAVQFVGSYADRLIIDPGAEFVGAAQGGGGSNTLELAQGTGGNAGTITGFSTQYLGFGTIDVDRGAAWSLVNAGTLASGTILVDSGVLTSTGSLGEGGSLAVAGGAATGVGGSLFNAGTLGLTGTIEVQAGVAYLTYLGAGGVLTNSATLTNAGIVLIDGAGGGGVSLAGPGAPGGTLANNGVLLNSTLISLGGGSGGGSFAASGAGGVLTDSGTLVNAGTISLAGGGARYGGSDNHGGYGAGLVVSGTLVNGGSLGIGAGATGSYAPGYDAVVTVTATGTLSGAGSVSGGGSLINHGSVLASGAIAVGYLFNDGMIGASAVLTDAGRLVNQGSIATTVTLAAGATLDNSGVITGADGYIAPAFVTNTGTITTTSGAGVYLGAGGAVTNMSGASIASTIEDGILIGNAAGTVTNTGGRIVGQAEAVELDDGGMISNLSGGVLLSQAGNGAYIIGGSGTITNAGTIIGGAGYDAVKFNGNFTDRLIIDPGAVFTGNVQGGSGSNTLELAQGSSGNIGTISGLGTQFTGFGTIDVDAGASWSLTNPGSIAVAVTLAAGATLYTAGTIADASSLYAVTGYYAQNAVTNTGTLTGSGVGVFLQLGGVVTNTGGTITGTSEFGVFIGHSPGTVTNDGGRIAGNESAVGLHHGGIISNLSGGVLLANFGGGAYIRGGTGTIINAGMITGYYGAYLGNGGTISNASGALLDGTHSVGAEIKSASGTIINAGTIIGDTGYQAVYFGGNFTDRLIVDPGAVFTGAVQGGSGSNTLELAPGSSGNSGTISGIGTQFTGFQSIDVDAGASWAFDGSDTLGSAVTIGDAGNMIFSETLGHTVTVAAPVSGSGGVEQSGPGKLVLNGNDSFTGGVTLGGGILELASGNGAAGHGITFAGAGIVRFDALPTGTIYGFANTATIDLPTYSYLQGAQATLAAGNTLVVQSGSETFDLLLDPTQDFGGVLFSVHQDAGTGILVEEASAPCYARGTQLLTAQGEVAIEALRVGDQMVTASGALRPVRWIGRRSYAGGTIGSNRDILPICLRAGALADGVPRRDLHVSPKHAMFLDGVLIPAELLVNGVSIVQVEHVEALTYYHVELDSHDVLIAEGAPSESFIDHDSRVMFDNAAAFRRVQPARREDCVPRVEDGEVLARVRQRIAVRAGLVADHADDAAEEGPLDGRLDLLDASGVAGWAFDARRPHTPIRLDILDGERVIGTVVANRFRPDLRPAGKGDGRCAYVFRFDLPPADLRGISLRRSSDGAMLPAQEAELRAA